MQPLRACLLIAIIASPFSNAGGLYLYQIGTDDLGLGNAGLAARAQDPSVIFMNPAGISRLEGRHAIISGQGIYGHAVYDPDNPALPDTQNTIGWLPAGSAFYSQQIDRRWTAGIGLYGGYGMGLDFGDWAGSTLVKSVKIQAMTLKPSLAYRFDSQWSAGVGLGINYGLFSYERSTAGGNRKDDSQDIALNAHLGVLYELTPRTRFGVGYASRTDYDFNVETTVTASVHIPLVGDVTKQFDLPIQGIANTPQQLMISGYHELNPQWAIMGNLGWQDWSDYANSNIELGIPTLGNINVTPEDRLQDTYHLAFGVQHRYSSPLTLNLGIAYDTSLYDSQNNTSLTMPSGGGLVIGSGFKYRVAPGQSMGMAFQYLSLDSSHVQSEGLSGTYHHPSLFFLSLNYSWDRF